MAMTRKARILSLKETQEEGITRYRWEETGTLWVEGEATGRSTIFSKVGLGAEGWSFACYRPDSLTLHNALRVGGEHFFLTAVRRQSPASASLEAARIAPRICRLSRVKIGVDEEKRPVKLPPLQLEFPGYLTEKYLTHRQEEPMAVGETLYVLVTPKALVLQPGELVEVEGKIFAVLLGHLLDPFKNEYEIARKEEA